MKRLDLIELIEKSGKPCYGTILFYNTGWNLGEEILLDKDNLLEILKRTPNKEMDISAEEREDGIYLGYEP